MRNIILTLTLCLVTLNTAAEIKVDRAYVPALPPTAMTLAAYFTITNEGETDRVLMKVESDLFGMVHLHHTMMKDGVASMHSIHKLVIKAGDTIELSPGGMHVMLMKPKGVIADEEAVPLVLVFEDGERLPVKATVQKIN